MFPDFTSDYEGWRECFIKHQNQIVFGTDNAGDTQAPSASNVARCLYRTYVVRNFLEGDHEFQSWEARARGFALEKPVLEKIYSKNFERYAGADPKKADPGLVLEDCEKAIRLSTGCTPETLSELHRVHEHLKVFA
jgi:hypothetical protein